MLTAKRPQRTIARDSEVRGVGFLTGADVRVRFRPAAADSGVVFVRADLPGRPSVPAHIAHVVPRQRRTSVQRGEAVVEMVEHVMAALAGARIDNCVVELDASETPGCDGSSLAFSEALGEAGAIEQDRPREALVIDRPVTVRDGNSSLTAFPGGEKDGLVVTYNLDYGRDTPIGRQSLFLEIDPRSFHEELAPSRTFLLEAEAYMLRQAGIGRRTTARDLLVFGPEGPIENHLRYPDECVRHKMLDVVGDLALLGRDIAGHVVAHRSGHQLNAELVRKLHEAVERARQEGDDDQPAPARRSQSTLPVMDINAIMAILPHRYPFLLIDRVVELEAGQRVVAIKNVSINEPYFQGHWPDRPLMPGVLILEALAQAGGMLVAHWFDAENARAVIAGMDEVKLRRPVVPGDQMHLEVTTVRSRSRLVDVQARALVEGEVAAEAQLRFVLVPK
jgi:UDP-3-O-[3-hydroxymyristoyl] N-acetylglucosamine deacetylase/3-hydroxyacyl-[acyl-carrier-protein] dehydratase